MSAETQVERKEEGRHCCVCRPLCVLLSSFFLSFFLSLSFFLPISLFSSLFPLSFSFSSLLSFFLSSIQKNNLKHNFQTSKIRKKVWNLNETSRNLNEDTPSQPNNQRSLFFSQAVLCLVFSRSALLAKRRPFGFFLGLLGAPQKEDENPARRSRKKRQKERENERKRGRMKERTREKREITR